MLEVDRYNERALDGLDYINQMRSRTEDLLVSHFVAGRSILKNAKP